MIRKRLVQRKTTQEKENKKLETISIEVPVQNDERCDILFEVKGWE